MSHICQMPVNPCSESFSEYGAFLPILPRLLMCGPGREACMDAVSAVTIERNRRGWSIRRCATAGGISNTHWGEVEKGTSALTDKVREAVATAFGWPLDWPENPPAPPAVAERDDQVLAAIAALADRVELLAAELRELRTQPH